MNFDLGSACIRGLERLSAWSDVLDQINVFPVADGDTGRNMIASLTPLREKSLDHRGMTRKLLMSARGNSGNIAVGFVSGLIAADSFEALCGASRAGIDKARSAVGNPLDGTMLSVLETLTGFLDDLSDGTGCPPVSPLVERMVEAVHATHERLPELKKAGVVDAGALGMFLFLEGLFIELAGNGRSYTAVQETFCGRLSLPDSYRAQESSGYCIDAVLRSNDDCTALIRRLTDTESDVVSISDEKTVKLHLHTGKAETVRHQIEKLGDILHWQVDDLAAQTAAFASSPQKMPVHIMTDAAGSLTRDDARRWGITLLPSYITAGERCLPETEFAPAELYALMRRGIRATTSQASVFEREQRYQQVLSRFKHVLYLCVGSVYTGNYALAAKWQGKNDPEGRLTVIDSGAASGRLAAMVLETVRHACEVSDVNQIISFARKAVNRCREYVFLDKLKYLAAGGRLSRTSAVLGDLARVKPIISPFPDGARKIGSVKSRRAQLDYACERICELPQGHKPQRLILQYSDNRRWVETEAASAIAGLLPAAAIQLQPLSLTSGVHMGPGTWGLAFMAEDAGT